MRSKKKQKEKWGPYRRTCLVDAKELLPKEKLCRLSGANRFFVDHKKKEVRGVCKFHAELGKKIAKRNLRRTLEKN